MALFLEMVGLELLLPYQAHLLLMPVEVEAVNTQKMGQPVVLVVLAAVETAVLALALLQLAALLILVAAAVEVVGNQALPIMLAVLAALALSS